jgi:lipoate-protein ligase B
VRSRQEQFRAGLIADPPGLLVRLAGQVPYRQALAWQEQLLAERTAASPDQLLLLEHPPVVTFGRAADEAHLRRPPAELAARGIDLVVVSRGGAATYHGPGQLVGYPLIDLNRCGRDLHAYLRRLEEVLIRTVADFGLTAGRCAGRTGVWLDGRKIASIGVAVRQWVTWHGFALNVGAELDGFAAIVPCALPDMQVTSLTAALGRPVATAEITGPLINHFAAVFDRTLVDIDVCSPTA